LSEKIKLGYYSSANGIAGTEIYLRSILLGLNYDKFQVVLFCTKEHPFLREHAFKNLINKEFIKIVNTDGDDILVGDALQSKEGNDKKEASKVRNVWIKYCPKGIKYLAGFIKSLIRIKKVFKVHSVSILHINDDCSEPIVLSAKLAGIPNIICTLHVLPSEKKISFDSLVELISVRCCKKMIAVSMATKGFWIERYGIEKDKVEVIYNGVDFLNDRFLCDVNKDEYWEDLGLKDDDLIVIVPGRLHIMKGYRYLIEAMPKIVDLTPNVKFLFIGDGPYEESLKELINKLGVNEQVLFLGYRTDIIQLMKISDLVVLPSLSECLPYVLLEAHACGKAIVATNISGIPEIVEDKKTGLLVPVKNSEKLAEAVSKLLSDDSMRNRMAVNGKNRINKLFTVQNMLSKTYELYDFLLKNK